MDTLKNLFGNLFVKLMSSKKATVVIGWALARILTPVLGKFGLPADLTADVINALHDAITPLITWLAGQSAIDLAIEAKRPRFNDKGQLIDKDGNVIEPPALP